MMCVCVCWCAYACFVLVLAWSTLLIAQPKQPPTKPQLDEAQAHMTAGSSLYNDPAGPPGAKCEEALAEFSRAYDLSGSWKALRAMAICEQKLERDGVALK